MSHKMFSRSTGSLIVRSMYFPRPDFSISITVFVLKQAKETNVHYMKEDDQSVLFIIEIVFKIFTKLSEQIVQTLLFFPKIKKVLFYQSYHHCQNRIVLILVTDLSTR